MGTLHLRPALEPLRSHIEASLRPRLALSFADDEGDALRGTRLGGEPAADPSGSWPMGASGPLTFLGQLDFEELSRLGGPDLGLPDAGILALYYDLSLGPKRRAPAAMPAVFQVRYAPAAVGAPVRPAGARTLPRRALDGARSDIPSMPHLLDLAPQSWPGYGDVDFDEETGEETGLSLEYSNFLYGHVGDQVRGNAHWVQQDPRIAELTPPSAWSLLWQIS